MAEGGIEGIVSAAIAPLNADARIASEQVSQLLRGQSFSTLEQRGEWLNVVSEDKYNGWLNRGYTRGNDGAHATHLSLGCVTADGSASVALPFGALLFANDRLIGGDVVSIEERAGVFPADARAVAESALRFFRGTPYLWGGVTPWGADCSGFLQNLFRMHAIVLPRDSSKQAECGTGSESTPGDNRAGELLFFSEREDRRITHVGLSLGGSRMAHVALGRGGFAVEDFSETGSADAYVGQLKSRFRFARKTIER